MYEEFYKKSIAVLLIIALMSGLFTCFAAKPYEKRYYDYSSYVLLGDSVASGWSDVEERETRFVRVECSYGAYVADDLGVEYHPMACIGFRMNAGTEEDTVNSLIDLACLCGALPDIIRVLPNALKIGIENYVTNWNYMIEDIYALNPDVTLLVIGMFDNMVQDRETADKNEAAALKLSLSQLIVDLANKPMIEGVEKYGYTFVDTTGTICEQNHPSKEGHRHIADLILEALPDANFPYKDVPTASKEYKAVEYMFQHGIMKGSSKSKFGYDRPMTMKQLDDAVYTVSGIKGIVEATNDNASYMDVVSAAHKMVVKSSKDVNTLLKATILTTELVSCKCQKDLNKEITRAEAAVILKDYIDIM